MKYIKIYFALLIIFLSALSLNSARASVDIVNLSTIATGVNPFTQALGPNGIVYVENYTCGCIKVYDFTNKSSPVLLATTSTDPLPDFVVATGTYAYVGAGNVLDVFDMSNPSLPTRVYTYTYPVGKNSNKMRIVGQNLFINFSGNPGGILILSLANPALPTLVSQTNFTESPSGVGDVLPIGNYMYVANYFAKAIRVYDISNLASPQLRQNFSARSENALSYKANQFEPWRLLSKGNALYIMDDDIIEIYDISSSTNIVYATTTVAGRDVEGAEIRGDLMYYSSSGVSLPATNKKIQIFNIKDPFNIVEVGSKINGLNNYWVSIDSNGYYYTSMASDALVGVYSPIEPPVIATSSPTNVSTSSITLNASITTNNNASTTDRGFNYGTTASYGSVASSTGTFNIGSFSQNLSSLTCNTLYHYQVFATNTAGTATSSDQTFTTSSCPVAPTTPSISLASPTSITATTIILNATTTSDGNASSTDRGFNYGLTTSYGSVASTTGTFGLGAFSQSLTSLTCATTYHYRAFSINSAGTATTTDSTFTTSSCPVVAVTPTQTSSDSSSNNSGGRVSPQVMTQLFGGQSIPNMPIITSSFARSLTTGASGSDVKNLQIYLNSKGYSVALAGPGSKGNETSYFGGLTLQALAQFQKANNIYPPAGFFGPITRAFITKNP